MLLNVNNENIRVPLLCDKENFQRDRKETVGRTYERMHDDVSTFASE